MTEEFDNIEIKTEDEILTDAELEKAETALEAEAEAVEELPEEEDAELPAADPEADPEDAGEEEVAEASEPDALEAFIDNITQTLGSLMEKLESISGRIQALEALEAKRSKKLTGFFAPIGDTKDDAIGELPRIEKRYIK